MGSLGLKYRCRQQIVRDNANGVARAVQCNARYTSDALRLHHERRCQPATVAVHNDSRSQIDLPGPEGDSRSAGHDVTIPHASYLAQTTVGDQSSGSSQNQFSTPGRQQWAAPLNVASQANDHSHHGTSVPFSIYPHHGITTEPVQNAWLQPAAFAPPPLTQHNPTFAPGAHVQNEAGIYTLPDRPRLSIGGHASYTVAAPSQTFSAIAQENNFLPYNV